MYSVAMNTPAANPQSSRHSLSDWLALHGLDAETCRSLLDAMAARADSEPASGDGSNYSVDVEAAWLTTVEAMRDFLPGRRSVIDDTFDNTEKILVDRADKPRKALTLDNGPGTYPTILYSYRGEPRDHLVIAHEFGHALQIRASHGKFLPPVVREICAFLGEGALLSYILAKDPRLHDHLLRAWRKANRRHFGAQKDRLRTALSQSDAPYDYSWNYPVARYLAIQISERRSVDLAWGVFEGQRSLSELLGELRLPPI